MAGAGKPSVELWTTCHLRWSKGGIMMQRLMYGAWACCALSFCMASHHLKLRVTATHTSASSKLTCTFPRSLLSLQAPRTSFKRCATVRQSEYERARPSLIAIVVNSAAILFGASLLVTCGTCLAETWWSYLLSSYPTTVQVSPPSFPLSVSNPDDVKISACISVLHGVSTIMGCWGKVT